MSQRTIIRGSTEYLDITVRCDFTLGSQTVEFSWDKTTWYAAAWIGTAGLTRTARLLLTSGNTPAGTGTDVYVRVTDSPEVPILWAGRLNVRG
jgi:hypothetical protein